MLRPGDIVTLRRLAMREVSHLPILGMLWLAACSESPVTSPDAPVGTLRVTVSTTGPGATPTQVQLVLGEGRGVQVIANGSTDLDGQAVGDLAARVVVPGHCAVDHYAPRTAPIREAGVTELTWSMRCLVPMAPGMVLHTSIPEARLWRATAIGDNVQSLESSGTDHGLYPVANPARTRIAYVGAIGPEQGTLRIMDADGSNDRELASSVVGSVDWSPDGSQLVITHGITREIMIIWADGTPRSIVRTLPVGGVHGGARWSPEGGRVAYREGAYTYVQTLASGQRINLLNLTGPAGGGLPAWSPDGARLAYTDVQSGTVWRIDADGTNATQIANVPGVLDFIDWGGDDRLLFAVAVPHTGIRMLRTMPVSGGDPTELDGIPSWATFARWTH